MERTRAEISLSTVAGNRAVTADGGGMENDRGNLTLIRTTMSGNRAGDNGGGIANDRGTTAVYNSTISANSAGHKGGGIDNRFASTLLVQRSTVVGNRNGRRRGVSRIAGAPGSPTGSPVSEARSSPAIHRGTAAAARPSRSDGTCPATRHAASRSSRDLPSTAPVLGPLAANGGPTLTHLPAAGSPALDAGIAAAGVDQRGVTRPQGPASDIGAVERSPAD